MAERLEIRRYPGKPDQALAVVDIPTRVELGDDLEAWSRNIKSHVSVSRQILEHLGVEEPELCIAVGESIFMSESTLEREF